MQKFLIVLLTTLPLLAQAHEGHGEHLDRSEEDIGFDLIDVKVQNFELEISLSKTNPVSLKTLSLATEYLGEQLERVQELIPAKAFIKLRDRVRFELEDRPDGKYFPTYYGRHNHTIELWNVEHQLDILDGNNRRKPDRYGNDYIVFHELAHAWHDQFVKDGYENEAIKEAFNLALETYELEDENGDRYYWTTNHKEYFAEFTVMYFVTTTEGLDRTYMKQAEIDLITKLWEITLEPKVEE